MATRSGSLDPAAILHLLRHEVGSVDEIEQALERESGLLGLSGLSARVEELERASEPSAQLALGVYCYRISREIGAMCAALGGLDAIVFSGGVGEGSALVRARVCDRLGFLGVQLSDERNASAAANAEIARADSRVRVVVVRAREDVIAARAVRGVLR
jgi:acetate kinase